MVTNMSSAYLRHRRGRYCAMLLASKLCITASAMKPDIGVLFVIFIIEYAEVAQAMMKHVHTAFWWYIYDFVHEWIMKAPL